MRLSCKEPAGIDGEVAQVVSAREIGIDQIIREFLSRLDPDQARAFRAKMAQLDAERHALH